MCLAVPARVMELHDGDMATVNLGGVKLTISLALVADIAVEDYVIVHVGYALSKLDRHEAERTLAMLADVGNERALALTA
ncbi:MAG: HypC/HybG/HupF family hydrogenase formation chaperone [Rhodospirillaceae bacterium]